VSEKEKSEVIEVSKESKAFLVYQNVILRMENNALKMKNARDESMRLNGEMNAVVMILAKEAGINESDFSKYEFIPASCTFQPRHQDEEPAKEASEEAEKPADDAA